MDGEEVALVDHHLPNIDPTAQGAATINLQLTAGQVVQLQNLGSSTVYGTDSEIAQSWFTGFMINAD